MPVREEGAGLVRGSRTLLGWQEPKDNLKK